MADLLRTLLEEAQKRSIPVCVDPKETHFFAYRGATVLTPNLAEATILTHDPVVVRAVTEHADLIAEELNVKSVRSSRDESELVTLSAKCDFSKLGPRFGPPASAGT